MKKLLTIPRLIGLFCVIIASIGFALKLKGSFGLVLAGIILLLAPTKHAVDRYKQLITTLKRWRLIVYSVLLDGFFWAGLFVSFLVFRSYILANNPTLNLDRAQLLNEAVVQQNISSLQGLIMMLLLGLFVLLLINVFTYALSRAQIWLWLTSKKAKGSYWKKFAGLSFLWWGFWVGVITLLAASMRAEALRNAFTVAIIVAVYFVPFVQFSFIRKHVVWKSISSGIKLGFETFPSLIVPFAFLMVVYVLLFQVFRFIPTYVSWYTGATLVFMMVMLAIARTYIYEILKR